MVFILGAWAAKSPRKRLTSILSCRFPSLSEKAGGLPERNRAKQQAGTSCFKWIWGWQSVQRMDYLLKAAVGRTLVIALLGKSWSMKVFSSSLRFLLSSSKFRVSRDLVLIIVCPSWLVQRGLSVTRLYLSQGLGKLWMVSFSICELRGT